LGPSGCGKTTTLRLVAGLEQPDAGEITLRDRLVASVPQHTFVAPHRRNLGMVFQSYAIWPHMTVFENVAYPLELRGVRRAAIRDFIGQTGILRGVVKELAGDAVAVAMDGALAGSTLRGRPAPGVALTVGTAVQLAIRPEDIEVTTAGDADGNALVGTIEA